VVRIAGHHRIGFDCHRVGWLKIVGIVLAAPVLWCYFVVIFIFLPYLVFDRIRKGSRNA
jgi:hypothetical protein